VTFGPRWSRERLGRGVQAQDYTDFCWARRPLPDAIDFGFEHSA
jgi:hypothetical protein